MDGHDTLDSLNVEEIGKWARFIDTEKTIFERMKIKKRTLVHLSGALALYLAIMAILAVIL
jgi:hypothetical protein